MSVSLRQYAISDFEPVSEFLIANYKAGNRDGNWLQPAWEYMHTHPALDESSLSRIGLWEREGALAAVAHYESSIGEAFFQVDPESDYLKPAMLAYAEAMLSGEKENGGRVLKAYVNDFDVEFESLVISRGYELAEGSGRPMSWLEIPETLPTFKLPEGFHLRSLADDNDLRKVHRVLWRGFNHAGEPPEAGIEDRRKMQSGPRFRKDLTIVVEEPGGDFVSFSGLWFEQVNRIAYVEPVATDPDFRRMGLGAAGVWEGIRRCGELGAREVFVGSELPFYKAIGFRKLFDCNCWLKYF